MSAAASAIAAIRAAGVRVEIAAGKIRLTGAGAPREAVDVLRLHRDAAIVALTAESAPAAPKPAVALDLESGGVVIPFPICLPPPRRSFADTLAATDEADLLGEIGPRTWRRNARAERLNSTFRWCECGQLASTAWVVGGKDKWICDDCGEPAMHAGPRRYKRPAPPPLSSTTRPAVSTEMRPRKISPPDADLKRRMAAQMVKEFGMTPEDAAARVERGESVLSILAAKHTEPASDAIGIKSMQSDASRNTKPSAKA